MKRTVEPSSNSRSKSSNAMLLKKKSNLRMRLAQPSKSSLLVDVVAVVVGAVIAVVGAALQEAEVAVASAACKSATSLMEKTMMSLSTVRLPTSQRRTSKSKRT